MLDMLAVKEIDILQLVSSTTKLDNQSSREYTGPCPKCGGKDRFHVNLDRGWFCRTCTGDPSTGHWHDALDFVMWRDGVDFAEAYNRLIGGHVLSAVERQQIEQDRQAREVQRKAEDAEKRVKAQAGLEQIAAGYHASLDKMDKRDAWRERGLLDLWQDYFQVGYNPGRAFYHDERTFNSPSLVIPSWTPAVTDDGDLSWRCTSIVHRLLIANPPGGKYRPERAGLGKPVFRCDLYSPIITGPVLLVEGEIKAMITWQHLQEFVGSQHPTGTVGRLTVVGISGKGLSQEQASELAQADGIWICLDPDAGAEAVRAARMLGVERCRIVDLPGKIDDMLIAEQLEAWQFASMLRQARRIK